MHTHTHTQHGVCTRCFVQLPHSSECEFPEVVFHLYTRHIDSHSLLALHDTILYKKQRKIAYVGSNIQNMSQGQMLNTLHSAVNTGKPSSSR